jgi:hypothetical protein
MALKTVVVCDRTGDPGAEPVVFGIGDRVWTIDLTGPALKELEATLQPWIAVARPGGLDRPGPVEPDLVDDDGSELTAEERTVCRAWAQQNQRRLNLPTTGDQGRLRQVVVDTWIEAGKPEAKRPPKRVPAGRTAGQ